jgi:hypothetical protein
VSGHLLGRLVGSVKDLQVGQAGPVEGGDLLMKGLDLIQVRRLSKAISRCLLGGNQPGSELLDAGPVLSPEFDIVGVFVALDLGITSQLGDIVADPLQLVLPGLRILVNAIT